MFRRKPAPPEVTASPSDVSVTAGRMWSPDSPWNTTLGHVTSGEGIDIPVEIVFGPQVVHVRANAIETYIAEYGDDGVMVAAHNGRVPAGRVLSGHVAVVDHNARTVVSGRDWHYEGAQLIVSDLEVDDLDGDGWGSAAAGLVMEREILGEIGHAVAVLVPWLDMYGQRLRLDTPEVKHLTPVERTLAHALTEYGAIVVGQCAETAVQIICERSAAASPGDVAGPVYRSIGISGDHHLVVLGASLSLLP